MNDFILIAITDPLLHPEATHAAAATGCDVQSCTDPRDIARFAARARTILVDASTAAHVGACRPSAPVIFLAPDPGPIDYEAALSCHADAAFIVPAQAGELLAALGRDGDGRAEGVRAPGALAVVGAVGGVGTSTLAAALARELAPSVLVDGKPAGGGIDLLLGLEEQPGVRWPDLRLGAGVVDAADIVAALPETHDGVAVLSGARSSVPWTFEDSAIETVDQALRGTRPVVIDGAVPETAECAVVVTAAEVRAAAAAVGLVADLAARGIPYAVVLRHRGWSSLEARDIERMLHADILCELPTVRRLAREVELAGLPHALPRPLRSVARTVLGHVGWSA